MKLQFCHLPGGEAKALRGEFFVLGHSLFMGRRTGWGQQRKRKTKASRTKHGASFLKSPLYLRGLFQLSLFILPKDYSTPTRVCSQGPPSLHLAPTFAAILFFAELPNTAAQASPWPSASWLLGSWRCAPGVPRWVALSFYQQKRRQLSPDVWSFRLQTQPCPVPYVLPRVSPSGEEGA